MKSILSVAIAGLLLAVFTCAEAQPSSLALLKTAAPSTISAAGQTITYSFLVINTGNVALTNVSTIDTAFSGSGTPPVITCPTTNLAPHQSTACTGTYITTQADIDAGSITNTATASGTPPIGPVVTSNSSTAAVGVISSHSMGLLKTASPAAITGAGQTITYSCVVTNTGNTALSNTSVADIAFSGTGIPPVFSCPVTALAPGAQTTCTAS